MNFFKAQAQARRKTVWLILLFGLAVTSLICLSYYGYLMLVANLQSATFLWLPLDLRPYYSGRAFFNIAMALGLIILFGSLFKTLALSTGGPAVAQMLGGKLVSTDTRDFKERRLLNIVEEMAIAAGMPIPQVYLLRENSINAFAAGLTPASAVIGITQGAMTLLTRSELQGVIAHEFSHILNGDMRLNIRLIGVLHGILMIGVMGYYLLRTCRVMGSSRDGGKAVGIFFALGLSLMAIGYTGTFFGSWIKASVSRQREYLADSSAVQFTRNKDGISGALKKIGGSYYGSTIESVSASEFSHAYFAEGVTGLWQSIFATHPPLEKRIKNIDPGWDGQFVKPKPLDFNTETPAGGRNERETSARIAQTSAILSSAEQAIIGIGTLNEANVAYVQSLLPTIPKPLRTAAQSAYSARAVVYLLLIRQQADKSNALALMNQYADKEMVRLAQEFDMAHDDLDEKLTLPLLELCVHALHELSSNQYLQFSRCIDRIIKADHKVSLGEWVIQRFVMHQLDGYFNLRQPIRSRYPGFEAINGAAEAMLSLIAYIEHEQDEAAKQAFDLGKKEIGSDALNIMPLKALTLPVLNRALDQLMLLKPLLKPRFLKAFAAVLLADNHATTRGIEVMRAISSCLDCPMPPLPVSAGIS